MNSDTFEKFTHRKRKQNEQRAKDKHKDNARNERRSRKRMFVEN